VIEEIQGGLEAWESSNRWQDQGIVEQVAVWTVANLNCCQLLPEDPEVEGLAHCCV